MEGWLFLNLKMYVFLKESRPLYSTMLGFVKLCCLKAEQEEEIFRFPLHTFHISYSNRLLTVKIWQSRLRKSFLEITECHCYTSSVNFFFLLILQLSCSIFLQLFKPLRAMLATFSSHKSRCCVVTNGTAPDETRHRQRIVSDQTVFILFKSDFVENAACDLLLVG